MESHFLDADLHDLEIPGVPMDSISSESQLRFEKVRVTFQEDFEMVPHK